MSTYPLALTRARQLFDDLAVQITSDKALQEEHSVIEAQLHQKGQEILRQLFQANLDLRAAREKPNPCTGADGYTRSYPRPSQRPLETLFGELIVHRFSFTQRDVTGGLRRSMNSQRSLAPRSPW